MDWRVVPFNVDASIFFAILINGNLVIFFECHLEVTGVELFIILHSKIIN